VREGGTGLILREYREKSKCGQVEAFLSICWILLGMDSKGWNGAGSGRAWAGALAPLGATGGTVPRREGHGRTAPRKAGPRGAAPGRRGLGEPPLGAGPGSTGQWSRDPWLGQWFRTGSLFWKIKIRNKRPLSRNGWQGLGKKGANNPLRPARAQAHVVASVVAITDEHTYLHTACKSHCIYFLLSSEAFGKLV
jgi:hypothetical protein